LLYFIDRGYPFVKKAVPHKGHCRLQQIARRHHAFSWKINDDVATCVAAAQEEQPDLPVAAEERQRFRKDGIRRCGPDLLQSLDELELDAQRALERRQRLR